MRGDGRRREIVTHTHTDWRREICRFSHSTSLLSSSLFVCTSCNNEQTLKMIQTFDEDYSKCPCIFMSNVFKLIACSAPKCSDHWFVCHNSTQFSTNWNAFSHRQRALDAMIPSIADGTERWFSNSDRSTDCQRKSQTKLRIYDRLNHTHTYHSANVYVAGKVRDFSSFRKNWIECEQCIQINPPLENEYNNNDNNRKGHSIFDEQEQCTQERTLEKLQNPKRMCMMHVEKREANNTNRIQ